MEIGNRMLQQREQGVATFAEGGLSRPLFGDSEKYFVSGICSIRFPMRLEKTSTKCSTN
jgi:hypothetical protein